MCKPVFEGKYSILEKVAGAIVSLMKTQGHTWHMLDNMRTPSQDEMFYHIIQLAAESKEYHDIISAGGITVDAISQEDIRITYDQVWPHFVVLV